MGEKTKFACVTSCKICMIEQLGVTTLMLNQLGIVKQRYDGSLVWRATARSQGCLLKRRAGMDEQNGSFIRLPGSSWAIFLEATMLREKKRIV